MNRIEKLKQLLSDSPRDSFLKHALALEHVKAGDDAQAGNYFNEILEDDENYVGTYYHLGKLLERKGESQQAISVYEKGMEIAKKIGDNHALNELRSVWEELTDL